MVYKFFLIVSIAVVLLGLCSLPLQAQVKGLIVGPGAERFPIAVPLLKNFGSQTSDGKYSYSKGMADIVARDLELSGWFKVLNRLAYIEDPREKGTALGSFDFRDWSTIGAEALVKGGFEVREESIVAEFRLFDVYRRRQIVGKRYTAEIKDFRRIAHKFVDEIIYQFTGERGVFDTRIAYVSTGSGRFKEIYVANMDGTERVQLTKNRTINLSPSWSPNGRTLLYTSFKEGKPRVYQRDLSSGKDSMLSSRTGLNLGGSWSADGKTIAVSLERRGNVDVYLLDPSGRIVRRLTKSPAIDVSPSWSPEGDRLVFVSNRSGGPQLYIKDLANGETKRLTYTGGYNTTPEWSAKGDKIVYTGRSSGRFNIFTIDTTGGDPKMLTTNSGNNEDPSWSPDGRYIVFSSNRNGRYNLYVMRATGQNQRRLTVSPGDDTNPSWSPRLD